MTAMYDHLYVYLCQKESLLKYFDQTFYYAVLCGRSNHLSSVLLFAWKVTKKKGVSEKVELKFWQGYTIKSSPSSLVYLLIGWWLGLVIGGEINGVTGETQRRSKFLSAGMNFEGHAAPGILFPTCMALLTFPGPIKEGKVF